MLYSQIILHFFDDLLSVLLSKLHVSSFLQLEIDFFFLDELKLPQKISLQLLTSAIEQLVEDFNELYFHVPDVAEREAKKLTIRKRVSSEMPDRH